MHPRRTRISWIAIVVLVLATAILSLMAIRQTAVQLFQMDDVAADAADCPRSGPPHVPHHPFLTLHCPNKAVEDGLIFHPVPNAAVRFTHDDTVLQLGPYDYRLQASIGNALSSYFGYLSFAVLGGYDFYNPAGFEEQEAGFLSYLPKYLPTTQPPDRPAFTTMCMRCGGTLSLVHATCDYGWSYVAGLARTLIRTALGTYLHDQTDQGLEFPTFFASSDDWLIYDRMLFPDLVAAPGVGVATISIYDHLPRNKNYTLYILECPRVEGHRKLYEKLLLERDRYFQTNLPRVKVVRLEPSSITEDFARMVYAPNLLLVTVLSTFGLWAAIASTGNVLTMPLRADMNFQYDYYPPNVHVLKDQRVIIHPKWHAPSAELLGVSRQVNDTWFDTPQAAEEVRRAYLEESWPEDWSLQP